MLKKFLKIVSFVLIMTMVFSMTACGNTDDENNVNTGTEINKNYEENKGNEIQQDSDNGAKTDEESDGKNDDVKQGDNQQDKKDSKSEKDEKSDSESLGGPNDFKMPKDLGKTTDFEKFATADLDGNKVTNEIFEDYEYTIVDIWGTYCGPCIRAMPELEKIHKKYKDKGVNVVAFVIDAQNMDLSPNYEQVNTAKAIAEKQGATFKQMLMPMGIYEGILMEVQAIPTQVLVDKNGKRVTDLIVGGYSEERWKKVLDEKLKK